MAPAPYTPATLARIRAGAGPVDLDWPQDQYLRICHKHGIEPRILVGAAKKPAKRSKIGLVEFDPETGIVRRGYNDVLLLGRERDVFALLFAAAAEGGALVTIGWLIEKTGECAESHMSSILKRLARRLVPVRCDVRSIRSRGVLLMVEG